MTEGAGYVTGESSEGTGGKSARILSVALHIVLSAGFAALMSESFPLTISGYLWGVAAGAAAVFFAFVFQTMQVYKSTALRDVEYRRSKSFRDRPQYDDAHDVHKWAFRLGLFMSPLYGVLVMGVAAGVRLLSYSPS